MTQDEIKKIGLKMEVYKKELQNSYLALAQSPEGIRVITHQLEDLFIVGKTPEQQARANKAIEILVSAGLLEYTSKGIPTWESLLKFVRKLFVATKAQGH